jgi:hypothetical protein
MNLDWSDPKCKIGKFFTVKDALWLPSWKVLHSPSESEKAEILKMAAAMDAVREFLQLPISVHVWIRPSSVNAPGTPHHGKDYNAFVKGAKSSAHKFGRAVDWSCKGLTCDEVRAKLEPKLEEFGLRMEDLPGSTWVHLDNMPVKAKRFFKP